MYQRIHSRTLRPPVTCLLYLLLFVALGLVACSIAIGPIEGSEPEYHVSSLRPSAQATVSNEGNSAIVDVYSDNGIGSATITLVSGDWPESVVLRIHLQGLESLQFAYGETVINVSVNTQTQVLQSVTTGGADEAIDEQSSYWMPVTFQDKEGTDVDKPIAGGVIEVQTPADFHTENYQEFTINWIDFYR